jgi:hypothetical protein
VNLGEQIIAGAALLSCVVLLARLAMSETRRYRFDRAMRRLWWRLRSTAMQVWSWPSSRRAAAREARDAIERARNAGRKTGVTDGEWKGNVYTPKSMRKPRKPH